MPGQQRCDGISERTSVMRYAAIAAAILTVAAAAKETVYEGIRQNKDLSKFHEMLNRDEVLRKLLNHWPVTVFAPSNDAILKEQEWVIGRESKVVSYHVLNLAANKSFFPFTSTTALAGGPPLYLGVKETPGFYEEKGYFANNAKIVHSEEYLSQEGYPQVLYVIDELLKPFLSTSSLPPDADELLNNSKNYIKEELSAFCMRVKKANLRELFKRAGNHTYFIPIGAGIGHSFNRQQEVDKWVIRGHVIPKNVVFTRLAGPGTYHSDAYGEDIQVELSIVNESNAAGNAYILHAQSNTVKSEYGHRPNVVLSKIVKPNIPVLNGVVHLIENPLMIVDISVWKFLNNEKDGRLSEFMQLVDFAPDFRQLLMNSQEKTLFVPSNEAISMIAQDVLGDIRNNITAITDLLKLHLVNKSISTDDVRYGRHRESLSEEGRNSLYFRVTGTEQNKTLTVDGGGVKATAVQADIGAVDGMIHIIDRLLGMPYQTVYMKLRSDPDLNITYQLSELDEWSRILDSQERRYTFFVPSNEAWHQIQRELPTPYKQLTIGMFPYHVRKILDRHLVVGKEIFFDEINQRSKIQMIHGEFKIRHLEEATKHSYGYRQNPNQTLMPKGDKVLEWEGVQARIVRPDVRAINGVIHVIDRVMMKRRDLTKSGVERGLKNNSVMIVTGQILLMIWTLMKCL